MSHRPVITGLGIVTSLGTDAEAVRVAIDSGATGVREVRAFDASSMPQPRGAEIGEEDFRSAFRIPKAMKVADLRTRMAVLATARALESAGLADGIPDAERTGVIVGCSGSDMQVDGLARALAGDERAGTDTAVFGEKILEGLNPLWLLVNLPNMTSAHVSIQFDARGPNNTVMTDWVAGLEAVGEAARLIRTGEADMVLAGGADVGVLPLVYENFAQAGLFDGEGRESFVPGDGAAILVIEDRELALERGARILAEVEGDASCAWADDGNTVGGAARAALDDAGWERVDLLLASATGFPALDSLDRRLEALLGAAQRFDSRTVRSAVGFPLAATSTIDLALALSTRRPAPQRALASAAGLMGQSAALCLTFFPEVA